MRSEHIGEKIPNAEWQTVRDAVDVDLFVLEQGASCEPLGNLFKVQIANAMVSTFSVGL